MKYFMIGLLMTLTAHGWAQSHYSRHDLDVHYFYGTILEHNPDISHLIRGHPTGVILGWNKKTFGLQDWEARYNYPDWGVSLIYQNLHNVVLGQNTGLYAHYNFYFLKRQLMFRVGQGIAYASNPYDKEANFGNSAYGSSLLSSTYLMFNYKKERLWDNIGLQAGISLIHYSNANVQAPNNSTNTFAFNLGLNYQLEDGPAPAHLPGSPASIRERVKYNFVFRTGVNESDVVGMGQSPFYNFSFYADKRLAAVSAVQGGVDLFLSDFLKELIYYQSVAYPERNISPTTDYKRVGIFVGHELFINRLSLLTQLGYYVYYPFDHEGRIYNRVGLNYYITPKFFGTLALKAHGAKAEAVELGVGLRL